MSFNDENRFLFKMAQMYYEENMTQNEIANHFDINRSSVSRYLKKMREKNIVKISLDYSIVSNTEIAERLKEKFHMKEVIVVKSSEKESTTDKLRNMGKAASKFMDSILVDNDVIGFSWGRSLSHMVDEIDTNRRLKASCIPLIGGPLGSLDSKYHVNNITYSVAQKYQCASYMVDIPAIFKNKDARTYFTHSEHYNEMKSWWDKLTVAFVGIGSLEISNSLVFKNFYGEEFKEEVSKSNTVGDILSQFYDIKGDLAKTKLNDRLIVADILKLRDLRFSVGIAESGEKVKGIIGALNGHYINTLITNEETAVKILEQS
ncbi:sugar-binding transcriptional regulator [Mammaliicoccus lentus]|uniref:sugar-binding transcriptional regulator n=1 Tax=Mammaliicoccus lentus TaxID=42858 RepID=UPI003F543D1B